MKNKKALIQNTLQAIIAITGLILLFIAAYEIYINVFYDQALENAKTLANNIETKINALEEGQKNTFIFQGISPENSWFISGWGKNSLELPEKCFPQSCICICATGMSCQERSICRTFKTENIAVQNYLIIPPSSFGTTDLPGLTTPPKQSNVYQEQIIDNITLPSNFFQLEIEKTQNEIKITHYTQDYLDNKDKLE